MTTPPPRTANDPTSAYAPRLPLPPIICSDTPGTWAYDTMSRRVDAEILERTVQDMADDIAQWSKNTTNCEIPARLQALRSSLRSHTTLPPLTAPHDPHDPVLRKEWEEWQTILAPYAGETWLTAPWIVAEFYVYRQLMDALRYFDPVSPGYQYDPFRVAKTKGLVTSVSSAATSCLRALPPTTQGLAVAVSFALWGNQMDLSLWPAGSDDGKDRFTSVLEAATNQLLADDTEALTAYCEELKQRGGGNIDIIVDNAGFELVTDLVLGQFLVEAGYAKTVTFQTKAHPTFVSDALTKDVLETVQYYLHESNTPACVQAAEKWESFLQNGQWRCHQDFFWVQPTTMWAMTEPLRSSLQEHTDLAFVKGDANYRRLLGDREWDVSKDSFADVVGKFPVPVCALRTLKAELGCGMDADLVATASKRDPNWMTNGQFGVIQFSKCD